VTILRKLINKIIEMWHVIILKYMATPVIVGIGAVATALVGRHLLRRGLLGVRGVAEQWAKGGFKAKMDRKEAIAILGLKYVSSAYIDHKPTYFYRKR
jgi:hypothetical protein